MVPDNFPNHVNDIDFNCHDKDWVRHWHAFMGVDDGAIDEFDNEDPISSLGADVHLPTPEQCDNYLHASVMLPHGDLLARGKVVGCKCNACGNAIGQANHILILDSRVYHVEFNDDDMRELTANVIAKAINSSCDYGGNEYLLMDIRRTRRLCPRRTSASSTVAVTPCVDLQLGGTYAFNGKMGPSPGSSSRT